MSAPAVPESTAPVSSRRPPRRPSRRPVCFLPVTVPAPAPEALGTRRRRFAAALAVCLPFVTLGALLAPGAARAQTWTGAGGNTSWGTGANWSGGTAPGYYSTVTFLSGVTSLTSLLDRAYTVGSLVFSKSAGGASSAFTIGAANPSFTTLSVGGITNDTGATQTISASITVPTLVATFTNTQASGALVLSGASLDTQSSSNLTISGIGSTTIASVISGSAELTKQGTGSLTLTGLNGYDGATTINAGTVTVGTAGGAAAAFGYGTVTNNATLNLNSYASARNTTFINSSGATMNVTNTSTGSGLLYNYGTAKWMGSATAGGATILQRGSGVLDFSGVTSGSVSVGTLAGSGGSIILGGTTLSLSGTQATRTGDKTLTGSISGTGGLVKTGTGVAVLTGQNTYSGGTTVSGGILQVGNGMAGGSLGTGSVTNSATLVYAASSASGSVSITNNTGAALSFVDSSSAAGATITNSGSLTFGGVSTDYNGYTSSYGGLATPGNATILNNSGGTLTFNTRGDGGTASITNYGTLSYSGYGGSPTITNYNSLVFGEQSVFTSKLVKVINNAGATTDFSSLFSIQIGSLTGAGNVVLGGTLRLSGTSVISGVIRNASGRVGSLILEGCAMTLTGTQTFTGSTTIKYGSSLAVGTATTSGSLASGSIINNGTLDLINTPSLGASISNGYGDAEANASQGVGTINVRGSTSLASQVVGNKDQSSLHFRDSSSAGSARITNAGGTITFSGNSRADRSTLTNNGGTLTFTDNASADTATISSAVSLQFSGNSTADTASIEITGGSFGVGASQLSVGSLSGTYGTIYMPSSLTVGGLNTSTTIASVLTGGSLTKIGTGTLTLQGANTYTGTTTVSGGTLALGMFSDVSSSSLFTVASGATLAVSSQTTVKALSGAGNVTLSSNLVIDGASSSAFSGVISGGGKLYRSGSGTLTLSGANTYSGGTYLFGGTLSINDVGQIGSGPVTLYGGSLQWTGGIATFTRTVSLQSGGGFDVVGAAVDLTLPYAMADGGGLVKSGAGTLTLTGANSYAGTTTITGGTLRIGSGGTTGSLGAGSVTNNGVLLLNRSDALTVGGSIGGTGSVTKYGADTLTLTGTNTHTGGTTISAGTLRIGSGGTTGSIAGNITNSGALVFDRSDASAYGGVVSGTGSLTKTGAGTLTLGAYNTYTGATTVNAGTLLLSAPAQNGGNYGATLAANSAGLVINAGGTVLLGQDFQIPLVLPVTLGAKSGSNVATLDLGGRWNLLRTIGLGDGATVKNGFLITNGNAATTSVAAGASATMSPGIGVQGGWITDVGFGGALTVSGVVSNWYSNGTLTKTGQGTLTLSGANSYSGATTVSQGTLAAGAANTLSSASAVSVSGGALLSLGGFDQSVGGLSGAGSVALGGNSLTVGGSNGGTFTGTIGGTGGKLTKSGSGALTLSGGNTYTGGTAVNAGTLAASGTALGTGAVSVASGATLSTGATANATNTAQATATLTLSSLSLVAASGNTAPLLSFDLGASGASDQIVLSASASPFAFSSSGGAQLLVGLSSATGQSLGGGTYILMSFAAPQSAASLPSAGVFAAKATGNLARVNNGQFSWATNGGGQVTGLQFSTTGADATPEPGSLALLLLAGLPVTGAALRRRRQGRQRRRVL